ncbi:MFS transporter [Novosphingobium terrae]|uniref:MFS transporter n=1 Tax=Novosphingobium terrae TaxID=2726189 RepID=UPI00197F7F3C|nr:MFS transporter [Novosphingobium terrae]
MSRVPPRLHQINLATALLRSGFMPFLSMFLYERGLGPASIGMVMGFGSVVQLLATIPGGLLIDHTRGKPVWLPIVAALIVAASVCLIQAHGVTALLCAVAMMSLAEAVVVPAILVLNLEGMAPQGLTERVAQSQALGHIGRAAGLMLSGVIGSHFGFSALIGFEAIYLLMLLGLVWRTPLAAPPANPVSPSPVNPGANLLLLGVALGLFQIGNAVLHVLLSLELVEKRQLSGPMLASHVAMIAQIAMVVCSLLAARALRRWGAWTVLAASFAILPIRCVCALFLPAPWAIVPVEVLHGASEALQMVTIAGIIGNLYAASGRAGSRFSWVMLLQGIGTAASPLVGGYIAQHWDWPTAFELLGIFGLSSLAFWVVSRPFLQKLTSAD